MSIQTDLETFSSAIERIKLRQQEIKELKVIKTDAEARIKEYLKTKEQPGVKYKGYTILLDERMHKAREKRAVETERMLGILKAHGVKNPETVLQELKASEKVKQEKLVIR